MSATDTSEIVWRQYICRACGMIYDEKEGDPDSGIAPGTRFEDIPEEWECPICGVRKSDFEPYVHAAPLAAPATPVVHRARTPGVVIVGAGIAGRAVAEALRALDSRVPITLVTSCAGDVYHKPELSIALQRGLTVEKLRKESGAHMAARLGVHLRAGTFAMGIDPVRRRLRTTSGPLPYDHLVLAQGARPALPAALPADLCWRVNDLDAWRGLAAHLDGAPRAILIVGAGLVGCELAEDFSRAGHTVTLLDKEVAPLAALLPPLAAERLRLRLEGLGVRFLGGISVERAERGHHGNPILFTKNAAGDREVLGADIVVSATGLATAGRLARSAGLAFQRGIAVDPVSLRTSVEGIYALGDCVSIAGAPCRFIEPIAKQAEAIAHHVLGLPHAGYAHAAPVIRLKSRALPVALHGLPHPNGAWRVISDDGAHLEMEQWHDGVLRARLAA
ncbi:FAD-dependent oxidoreductase [Roseixanthobacter glucoisosaccharinicivorans]|uniref:FAD-dependent oxidoreductase n=1 Tax=Roseixanthobacter glucoisosaccharinicivorans TaxID=3119923 RepID=UPI00372B9F29